ncbi:MAG: response regulator transcription factor [Saprospiraceae bacterium]|jgi:DNA-binding NarL/FixJ family response regulator|nr:response regulator transcription factor [Saprospiraceae bacterium]
MTKIAVVDDDPVLLARMVSLIGMQENWRCVIQAGSLGEFFEKTNPESSPDVLLLDIQLKEINSLQHLDKIKKILPSMKIVIMTGYTQDKYVLDALTGGADGYFVKGGKPADVLAAIRNTLSEGAYLGSSAARAVVNHLRSSGQENSSFEDIAVLQDDTGAPTLSPREWEVAKLLVNGLSYKTIAAQFFISINTVRHHVKTIYRKMGVTTKAQLQKKLRIVTR